jgi:predicted DCC family thiol-disulfide oxidoreductase YuxK
MIFSAIRRVPGHRAQSPEQLPCLSLEKAFEAERLGHDRHLVAPDGRSYSGGEAVPQLARLLPAGAPIAALASTFPRTADRAYRWVARHRERLGRVLGEQACAVDPAERDW